MSNSVGKVRISLLKLRNDSLCQSPAAETTQSAIRMNICCNEFGNYGLQAHSAIHSQRWPRSDLCPPQRTTAKVEGRRLGGGHTDVVVHAAILVHDHKLEPASIVVGELDNRT